MRTISITGAEYIADYNIRLHFNDASERVINFGKFLLKHNHPQYNRYRDLSQFKKFKIAMGNIVWGKDWDIIFPIYDLYKGKI